MSEKLNQFILQILIVLATIAILWLIVILRSFIVIFLLASFFSLLLSPLVSKFCKWRIPNIVSILLTFLIVILIGVLFIVSLFPLIFEMIDASKLYITHTIDLIASQARDGFPFLNALPFGIGDTLRHQVDFSYVSDIITSQDRAAVITNDLVNNMETIKQFFQVGSGHISSIGVSFASGISSVIASFFLFVVFTFFILLDRKVLLHWFFTVLPDGLGSYFHTRQHAITKSLHMWLRGQLLLVFWMFMLNLVGLWIAQLCGLPIRHIFSLSLFAGFMEFVPYLGPIVAYLLGFLVVLFSPEMTPWSLLWVTIVYIIFQQIESNFMSVYILSKAIRLPTIFILITTVIGATLFGAFGVILAIPLASIIHIFYHDWMRYRKGEKAA